MFCRFSILLGLGAAAGFAANPTQPAISSNGVVNAASYLASGFSNGGIARGSLFLIFGNYLGPDAIAQAQTFPLPTILADTRIHLTSGSYSMDIPLVYTSAKQVAALMPSNAPQGDASMILTYRTLTSNPITVHIVRSAFGMFTLNQGGTGQAIVQNFVSQTVRPINTILSSVAPGGIATLWGTGLGPVASGDDASGPLPGALPYLDALYVGGQRANIRYAGRTACCAGVDQIDFDVPSSVQGCYVPVAAVVNGLVSNVGTIAVSPGGQCDDPLSFRAADLATLQKNGSLGVGVVDYWNTPASETVNVNFLRYTAQGLENAPAPFGPSAGSCYETETALIPGAQAVSYADPLNAGPFVQVKGPNGLISLQNDSPGAYSATIQPPLTFPGVYTISSTGGAEIGPFQGSFTAGAPLQWTNAADFTSGAIPVGQPLNFRWTPGDSSTYVRIAVRATGAAFATAITCHVSSTAGSFTVPDYLTRTILQGSVTISLASFSVQRVFTADHIDAGIVTAGTNTAVQATFQQPVN